jgi:hypothetical protein
MPAEAIAGLEKQLAYPPKLPKWLARPVTRVTTALRGVRYDPWRLGGPSPRGRPDGLKGERNQGGQPEEATMLWTIFVILLVLWLLGVVTSYTLGGFIHVLLVVAVVLAIMQLLQGRRAL